MTTTDNGAPRNLAAMRLPELRKLAADLGLKGVSALRKGALIAAITNASGDSPAPAADVGKTPNLSTTPQRQKRTTRLRPRKTLNPAGAAPSGPNTQVMAGPATTQQTPTPHRKTPMMVTPRGRPATNPAPPNAGPDATGPAGKNAKTGAIATNGGNTPEPTLMMPTPVTTQPPAATPTPRPIPATTTTVSTGAATGQTVTIEVNATTEMIAMIVTIGTTTAGADAAAVTDAAVTETTITTTTTIATTTGITKTAETTATINSKSSPAS